MPSMTYAEVEQALNQAATRDAFDEACDLIQYRMDQQPQFKRHIDSLLRTVGLE